MFEIGQKVWDLTKGWELKSALVPLFERKEIVK